MKQGHLIFLRTSMAANRRLYVRPYIIKHTATNAGDLMQVCYRLASSLLPRQIVETTCIKLNSNHCSSIHLLKNQSGMYRLQRCSRLLMSHFDGSLLTRADFFLTDRLVILKPEQMMRTHPDIGLMTASQQACSRRAAICAFLAVYL